MTSHSHTYAAQAQDGHKEEGAEDSASHAGITDWANGNGIKYLM